LLKKRKLRKKLCNNGNNKWSIKLSKKSRRDKDFKKKRRIKKKLIEFYKCFNRRKLLKRLKRSRKDMSKKCSKNSKQ
jgi:hypothetical protein